MTLASNGLQNAVVYRWTYTDATARTSATGFVSTDVGALALQQSDNTLWMLTATTPTWVQVMGTFTSPMTTAGDIITGGASGVAQRLGVGTTGQVLTVVSGAPAWATGGGGGGALPTRVTLWHDEAKVISGAALAVDLNIAYYYSLVAYQNPGANGDTFEYAGFLLDAGTYVFSVYGHKATSLGMIDWTLDGVSLVSGQDWYSASNVLATITNTITIATGGVHTLRGVVNGKNASSVGYGLTLTKCAFRAF